MKSMLALHALGHGPWLDNIVETTTGPLGQGAATGVGRDIAGAWIAASIKRLGFTLFDHRAPCARRRRRHDGGTQCFTSLLARELRADVLVMGTDVPAVYLDWGQPARRAIGKAIPQALSEHDFAAGATGPNVEAAHAFVLATGQRAVIGSLEQIDMRTGRAGAQVCLASAGGADHHL